MSQKNKMEFLIYTVALLLLLLVDFIIQLDEMFKDTDAVVLVGAFLYLCFAIFIFKEQWKYLGLISAFMIWTGSFCVIFSFLSFIESEPSTYSRIFNPLYAFCGVFGGIRMYRAWLRRDRESEQPS